MSETPSWQDLIDLLRQWDESGLESASVVFGDTSLSVSRTGQVAAAPAAPAQPAASPAQPAPAAAAAPAPTTSPADSSAAAAPSESAAPASGAPDAAAGVVVTAPMIGVFYRSPSPGKPEFASPGDVVDAETTIGIVEVMKLMNPVTAGVAGTFLGYDVADGNAIEFGQALARIDPS